MSSLKSGAAAGIANSKVVVNKKTRKDSSKKSKMSSLPLKSKSLGTAGNQGRKSASANWRSKEQLKSCSTLKPSADKMTKLAPYDDVSGVNESILT